MAKQLKQFEVAELPREVRDAFFDQYDYFGNDCWIVVCAEWNEDATQELDILVAWLKAQGVENGEEVLIEHAW